MKSFAANADCRLAIIVLFDSTVAVWDMVNMECSCMLQSWGDRDAARVHSAGVNAAYLSPSGSRAVTVSGDHTARVWDIATAECRCVLRGNLRSAVFDAFSGLVSLPVHMSDFLWLSLAS